MRVRAVRVVFGFALGVVFAVNRHPFFGDLPGGQPQPKTEEMRHGCVQIHRAVRLVAVQVDRDTGDGDVCDHQRVNYHLPP